MQVLSALFRGAVIMSLLFGAALASTGRAHAQSNQPTGHKWSYVYADYNVALTVSVGTWNSKSKKFIQIYRTDGYNFPCNQSGGQIVCNMNIKARILESYQKAGLNGVVGNSEGYDGIETFATGSWSSLTLDEQPTILASHSTVSYSVQTPNNNAVIFRGFVPSDPGLNKLAWSAPFTPISGMAYEMYADLVKDSHLPESDQRFGIRFDNPQQNVNLGQAGHNGGPAFELAANQLVITPVPGFTLKSFTVDPRMGSGG